VDRQDAPAYAARIGRLLDDPDLAAQMGARGRLLAQRFSWTRTADRLELLFERLAVRGQLRVQASARQE
jgi:glycosyltransferase involved in cell wall biosynthesis